MKSRDLIIGEFRSQLIGIARGNPSISDCLLHSKCRRALRYTDDEVKKALAEAYLEILVEEALGIAEERES